MQNKSSRRGSSLHSGAAGLTSEAAQLNEIPRERSPVNARHKLRLMPPHALWLNSRSSSAARPGMPCAAGYSCGFAPCRPGRALLSPAAKLLPKPVVLRGAPRAAIAVLELRSVPLATHRSPQRALGRRPPNSPTDEHSRVRQPHWMARATRTSVAEPERSQNVFAH